MKKDPGGRLNICLIYPNTYKVGMSNLGFTGLYTLFNRMERVVCERAFLPEKKGQKEKGGRAVSRMVSLESGRTLDRFDVIAFSVSFENDYRNVLKILSLSGIKHLSEGRGEKDPVVIAGGPCMFINPEPVADFMDAVFVGEVEESVKGFVDAMTGPDSKSDKLLSLSRIEGFYIPSFYTPVYDDDGGLKGMTRRVREAPERIKRVWVKDINGTVLCSDISSPESEFGNMFLIEAMRGCPFSCRFCAAGRIYDPPRQRAAEVIEREIAAPVGSGMKVGLIAPSLTEYRDVKKVLAMEEVRFSITSLRANRRSAEVAGMIRNKRSVSIAPEAGSQRLRDVVNKKVSRQDIISAAGSIFSNNIRTLKLYFMIGLPTETDADADAIIDLVKMIRATSKKGSLAVTLSVFVPKPFTPFQWHPMADIRTVRTRAAKIKKELKRIGVGVSHDPFREAYVQGLLANGDRRTGGLISRLSEGVNWKKACSDAGIDVDYYIHRRKKKNEVFPWDIIDNGTSKDLLFDEYIEAVPENDKR